MTRVLKRCVALLVTLAPFLTGSFVDARQNSEARPNGEARTSVPTVERTDYDMRRFVAPLQLSETELNGRMVFAQRCANCHGGSAQRPGPPLGKQTVERLGDAAIREKVTKGSPNMPGFEHTLPPARIDQIIAFLKTFTPPPARSQAGAPPE
jgi:mono/diheme cytochrome c family protein